MPVLSESAVRSALARVQDPEIRKPITDLGMVKSVDIAADDSVDIAIYLTTAGCPMRTEISDRVTKAVADVPGVGAIRVELDVMSDEQRTELRKSLRGDSAEPIIVRPARLADPRLRGRVRQGRCRQVQRHRQPCCRTRGPADCRWACSTPTSTDTPFPACSAPTPSPRRWNA